MTARAAILADIHGNLPALEAVCADIERRDIATIVVAGDVMVGPMARDCLDLLRALGSRVRWIRGNTDRLTVEAFDGRELTGLAAAVAARARWGAEQIDRERRDFLASLPVTISVDIDGLGQVLVCHATPRSDDEIFSAVTSAERVRAMFAGVTQRIVVCGHTHIQFDRAVDETRIVNAGSVGMPFQRPSAAYWLMLDGDVELRHTPYDLERAAERIRACAYPDREDFAARSVLDPPAADVMQALYEKSLSAVSGIPRS
jgi:putative phosphoesterase